jgi:hypothetical protein
LVGGDTATGSVSRCTHWPIRTQHRDRFGRTDLGFFAWALVVPGAPAPLCSLMNRSHVLTASTLPGVNSEEIRASQRWLPTVIPTMDSSRPWVQTLAAGSALSPAAPVHGLTSVGCSMNNTPAGRHFNRRSRSTGLHVSTNTGSSIPTDGRTALPVSGDASTGQPAAIDHSTQHRSRLSTNATPAGAATIRPTGDARLDSERRALWSRCGARYVPISDRS